MTAMTPPAEIPRKESYLEFVRRKFPDELHRIEGLPDLNDNTLWASLESDPGADLLFRVHRKITIVVFQTVPRKFVLQFSGSDVKLRKSGIYEMIDLIGKVSPFQGVLILWEYTSLWSDTMERSQDPGRRYWLENVIVAALAEASFADPANISNLRRYWRTRDELPRDPDDRLDWVQPTESSDNPLQKLERASHNMRLRGLNYLSNNQPRWLPLQSKYVLNLSSCRDTAVAQKSAYLVLHECNGFDIPDDLVNWAMSHSSPEAYIASATTLEVQTMLDASAQIADTVGRAEMNSDVYRASRCLRELSKTLTGELEHLGDTTNDALIPSNLSKMASELEKELGRFELYVQDAYQIFIDFEALKGTRKSIEMAEMSIEMSKKSIKESERVRILTIIALIFLPISLASSIFGMNVTIINSEKTPFFAFIVTAVGLFFGALLIWAGSSIFARYQKLDQALNKRKSRQDKYLSAGARAMLDIMLDVKNNRKMRFRAAVISWWTQRDAAEVHFEMWALDESLPVRWATVAHEFRT